MSPREWWFLLHVSVTYLWILIFCHETLSKTRVLAFLRSICVILREILHLSEEKSENSGTFSFLSVPVLSLPFTQSWWIRYTQQEKYQTVHKTQTGNRKYTQLTVHTFTHTVQTHMYIYCAHTHSVGLVPEWNPWCGSVRQGVSESKTVTHTCTHTRTL